MRLIFSREVLPCWIGPPPASRSRQAVQYEPSTPPEQAETSELTQSLFRRVPRGRMGSRARPRLVRPVCFFHHRNPARSVLGLSLILGLFLQDSPHAALRVRGHLVFDARLPHPLPHHSTHRARDDSKPSQRQDLDACIPNLLSLIHLSGLRSGTSARLHCIACSFKLSGRPLSYIRSPGCPMNVPLLRMRKCEPSLCS